MDAEAILEHEPFLRTLARSLVFAGEDPDEIVQDTWLAAVRAKPRPGPGIRGWLATVARNAVRERRRKRMSRKARELRGPDPRATPTPDEILERETVRRQVVSEVLALDEVYREVLLLRYFENLPPRDIAARLSVPVETVRTRHRRALDRLRSRLDREHDGDRTAWTALLLPLARLEKAGWLGGLAGTLIGPVGIAALVLLAVGGALAVNAGRKAPFAPVGPFAEEGLLVAGGTGGDAPERERRTGSAHIRGRVRSATGEIIPGVIVLALDGPDSPRSITDRDGLFDIPGLEEGREYELLVVVSGGATAGLHQPFPAEVVAGANGSGSVELECELLKGPFALVELGFAGPPPDEAKFSHEVIGSGGMLDQPVASPEGAVVLCYLGRSSQPYSRFRVTAPGYRTDSIRLDGRTVEGIVPIRIELQPGSLPKTGLVIDEKGRPVAGASLATAEFREKPSDVFAKTGEDGRFPLLDQVVGKHLVAFVPGESVSPWFVTTWETDEVVLRLGPGCTVEGTVRDRESGLGVPFAQVRLEVAARGSWDWSWPRRADSNGFYRFRGIPIGVVSTPMPLTDARGEALFGFPVAEAPDRQAWLEQGNSGRFDVDGAVFRRDLPMRRIPGIECILEIVPSAGEAQPEEIRVVHRVRTEDGKETVFKRRETLPGQSPRIRLFLPRGENFVRVETKDAWGRLPPRRVSGDGAELTERIVLSRRVEVTARLVTEGGQSVAESGVRISVSVVRAADTRLEGTSWSVESGADGTARITEIMPAPAGGALAGREIRIALYGKGIFKGGWQFPALRMTGEEYARMLREAEEDGLTLDLTVRRYMALDLTVFDHDGTPVPGVVVRGSPPLDFAGPDVTSDASGRIKVLLRKFDSQTRLEAMPPYRGIRPLHPLLQEIYRGKEPHPFMHVHRGAEREVRVLIRGLPATGRMYLSVEGDPDGSQTTQARRNEAGEWEGTVLVGAGPAKVFVHRGDRYWLGEADCPVGEAEVVVEVRPPVTHAAVVEFRDEQGNAVQDRKVTFLASMPCYQRDTSFRTDSSGRISLELPEGIHRLPRLRIDGGPGFLPRKSLTVPGGDKVIVTVPAAD